MSSLSGTDFRASDDWPWHKHNCASPTKLAALWFVLAMKNLFPLFYCDYIISIFYSILCLCNFWITIYNIVFLSTVLQCASPWSWFGEYSVQLQFVSVIGTLHSKVCIYSFHWDQPALKVLVPHPFHNKLIIYILTVLYNDAVFVHYCFIFLRILVWLVLLQFIPMRLTSNAVPLTGE